MWVCSNNQRGFFPSRARDFSFLPPGSSKDKRWMAISDRGSSPSFYLVHGKAAAGWDYCWTNVSRGSSAQTSFLGAGEILIRKVVELLKNSVYFRQKVSYLPQMGDHSLGPSKPIFDFYNTRLGRGFLDRNNPNIADLSNRIRFGSAPHL